MRDGTRYTFARPHAIFSRYRVRGFQDGHALVLPNRCGITDVTVLGDHHTARQLIMDELMGRCRHWRSGFANGDEHDVVKVTEIIACSGHTQYVAVTLQVTANGFTRIDCAQ